MSLLTHNTQPVFVASTWDDRAATNQQCFVLQPRSDVPRWNVNPWDR